MPRRHRPAKRKPTPPGRSRPLASTTALKPSPSSAMGTSVCAFPLPVWATSETSAKSVGQIGTERIASAITAGVYAKVADGTIYHDEKQVIALHPDLVHAYLWGRIRHLLPGDGSSVNVSEYRQELELRTGIVRTSGVWTSPSGNKTRFTYRVATDRARKHIAVVVLDVTPMWSGKAMVSSILDGAGARRLDLVGAGVDLSRQMIYVNYKTKGTNIAVAESATLRSSCEAKRSEGKPQIPETPTERMTFEAQSGKTCTFVKYVAVVTSRDSSAPESDARAESQQAADRGLNAFQQENRAAWDGVWKADIVVDADLALEQAIRANEYTLYASIAPDSPDEHRSVGPLERWLCRHGVLGRGHLDVSGVAGAAS